MTITGAIKDLLSQLKKKFSASQDPKKFQHIYPFYWLAPTIDRGMRRIRMCSLFGKEKIFASDSTVVHMSRVPGFLRFILPFIGLETGNRKNTAIRVAKLDGHYIIEEGLQWLRLARLINLDYVTVKVVEYDYKSLIKKMRIHKYPDFDLVSVPSDYTGNYINYGSSTAQVDSLIRRHKVPFEDHTLIEKPAAAVGQKVDNRRRDTIKRRSNLVMFKKVL